MTVLANRPINVTNGYLRNRVLLITMNTGNIFLIRHGQTAGNGNQYVGWQDLPLNKLGHEQARAIADALNDYAIDSVYCSTLIRAIETALPLANQKNLEVNTDSNLNEINYGAFQGKLKSELQIKLRKHYRNQPLPDGESLHDVYLRVQRFYKAITERLASQENMAIICHFWSIRLLLGALQGKAFDDIFSPGGYKPANGSIYKLSYDVDKLGIFKCTTEDYLTLS